MQYALPLVLPDVPAGGVCAGIDWATADHVACVVDMTGRVTDRFSAAHDKAGIAAMITRLRRSKVTEVAIERGDGPLVDALLAAGLTVVVITSRQVKNLRSRFGAAGAKDDLLTELADRSFGWCVRSPAMLARFRPRDQRRGYAAGVVRAGGAAARLA
jgi:hypothetical protein